MLSAAIALSLTATASYAQNGITTDTASNTVQTQAQPDAETSAQPEATTQSETGAAEAQTQAPAQSETDTQPQTETQIQPQTECVCSIEVRPMRHNFPVRKSGRN